ncbi:FHA domain protein [Bremerella volcania]|uniref:FHA domain protein n=1 Tax=Bremerella volcania TaxID=2527984 RepID=A0A518CAT7_9BACT|nr:FHA domain-containing protein [Bremerella volcania]QDU76342.1 FHA domain protein [Bremerella volcania]
MGSKKVWIVGARDTCDIVIDEPTVSGEHCRLEFDDGRVFIEDLQSTNGTFINGERIYKKKQIHPDALVTLGRNVTMPMPSQLSGPKPPPELPKESASAAGSAEEAPFPAHLMIAGGVGVTILLLIILFAIMAWSGGSKESPPVADNQEDVGLTDPSPGKNNPPSNDPTPQPPKNNPPEPTPKPQETVAQHSPEEAIYVLAVADENLEQPYRIGTGLAIGPHTILTTGTAKTISELARQRFPELMLLGPKKLTITQFVPHPTYVAAMKEGDGAEARFHNIYSQIDMNDISGDLKKTLEDAYRHFMVIAEKPHHYDVAVIHVQETLPYWLPMADTATLPPLSKLTLVGHGFDRVAPFIPPNSELPIDEKTVRIQSSVGEAGAEENARLLIAKFDSLTPTAHLETNWNGSALLNSQGELVAIYSRLTPEMTLGSPPTGQTFDATVIPDVMPFIRRFSKN